MTARSAAFFDVFRINITIAFATQPAVISLIAPRAHH
jgi:hypothetical protein